MSTHPSERPARPGAGPRRAAMLVAALATLVGCGPDPDSPVDADEPLILDLGQENPTWRALVNGSYVHTVEGLQGLLMLPLSLQIQGTSANLSGAEADFHGVMADTGELLFDAVSVEQSFERVDLDLQRAPPTTLISEVDDPALLEGRLLNVVVSLRLPGFGIDGGEAIRLERTLRVGDAAVVSACVFRERGFVSPDPSFVAVTADAGITHDLGPKAASEDCFFADLTSASDACTPEDSLGGVAVGDFDGDGWPDLFFPSPRGVALLYRNQGDGSFADASAGSGLESLSGAAGAAWLDLEGDGDLDLYVTTIGEARNYLFVNDGAGHFTEDAIARGADLTTVDRTSGTSVALGDYDRDGYVDVYAGEWMKGYLSTAPTSHARLLHNQGVSQPGSFADATASSGVSVEGVSTGSGASGVFVFAPAFVDLDGDGWSELALTSDFSTTRVFWNNADGTFDDRTEASLGAVSLFGMGAAFGDYDGDGDMDWFASSISPICLATEESGNALWENVGGRIFEDRAAAAAVEEETGWGWGAVFFDYDNDGDLDLAMTTGWHSDVFLDDPMHLYRNDGVLPFTEVTEAAGLHDHGQGRGLAILDHDDDGDLDLLVVRNADAPILYRNDAPPENGWLKVRLEGADANTRALGARVHVRTEPGGAPQLREMGVGGHFMAQSETVAHFGLGPGTDPVDQVRIVWPTTGSEQILTNVPRNQTLTVVEAP